jgi:putative ATP-dependent endonuclease of the OLD family
MSTPKISKLVIKNFGCIGPQGISVDIDKIVILVGANNAGKSTILRAFEVVTDGLKLNEDDFHNRQVSPENNPEIEVHSTVTEENKPGDEWCQPLSDGSWSVRERWTWHGSNSEPKRVGFNTVKNDWAQDKDSEKVPWGATNVAKSKRPKPHRVNTFDTPESQARAITSLLKGLLDDNIKKIKSNESDEKTRYELIVESLKALKSESKTLQQSSITEIQDQANAILKQIFPNCIMKIIDQNSDVPINIDLLGDEFCLEMGVNDGISFPLEKQGSGTQRTVLWTILKLLADKGMKAKSSSSKSKTFHESVGQNTAHILLIDEPEVSLHPRAISAARDALYALAEHENWQVMITTHSPSFIDLTKDNTTIIRAEKNSNNNIETTTLYRPDCVKLDQDDKENLKLMNLFDSNISEAFFGGRVLVVEGDTEYSAFNYIKKKEEQSKDNNNYHDLNIIRARGKVTIASMMKILNHFKTKYYVLHDTDRESTTTKVKDKELSRDGKIVYSTKEIKNSAWTNNRKISEQMSDYSRVVASIVNFEEAYFLEVVDSRKPESCINRLKSDDESYKIIKQLLDGILEIDATELPRGAVLWSNIDELDSCVKKQDSSITIS